MTDIADNRTSRTSLLLPLAWLVVVLLAIGLRIWMWSFQARSGAVQPGDPEEYYRSALYILQGGYYDTGKWIRPPLYPAFLALCFTLFGVDLPRALFAQALLTGLAVPVFGWLAFRLYRSEGAALVAGLLAACFIPFAGFGSVLFAESLFVILIVLVLAVLDRAFEYNSFGSTIFLGMLLGAAALTRAVALSFIPVAIVLLLTTDLPRPFRWRSLRFGGVVWMLIGVALLIGPWAVRNYAVHQRIILSDTNGGISMWYGVVRDQLEQEAGESQLRAIANPADRQAMAFRWTLERVQRDPLDFIGRMRFKIASLYLLQTRNYAVGDVITIDPRDQLVAMGAGEHPLRLSILADLQYVGILLAAIAGICYAPDRRRLVPLIVWVLFITFMSAITIGHPRLRLPILAALIPPAAFALTLLRRPPHISRGWLAILIVGWIGVGLLTFSTRYITWARTWNELRAANSAIASDQFEAAEPFLQQAHATDPTNALRVIDLADLAFRKREYNRALDLYTEAIKLEDRSLYAHAMRERMAILLGLPEIAQTEQLALAGYGRDSNELYQWAWATFDDPLPPVVVPGDFMALGHYVGFAPATPDAPTGRWTLDEARVRLSAGCGVINVRMRGPLGRKVQIEVEGHTLPQIVTLIGSEQTTQLVIPCTGATNIQPDTSPPVLAANPATQRSATIVHFRSPTSLLYLEQAPWYVGVAILEVGFEQNK